MATRRKELTVREQAQRELKDMERRIDRLVDRLVGDMSVSRAAFKRILDASSALFDAWLYLDDLD